MDFAENVSCFPLEQINKISYRNFEYIFFTLNEFIKFLLDYLRYNAELINYEFIVQLFF